MGCSVKYIRCMTISLPAVARHCGHEVGARRGGFDKGAQSAALPHIKCRHAREKPALAKAGAGTQDQERRVGDPWVRPRLRESRHCA